MLQGRGASDEILRLIDARAGEGGKGEWNGGIGIRFRQGDTVESLFRNRLLIEREFHRRWRFLPVASKFQLLEVSLNFEIFRRC